MRNIQLEFSRQWMSHCWLSYQRRGQDDLSGNGGFNRGVLCFSIYETPCKCRLGSVMSLMADAILLRCMIEHWASHALDGFIHDHEPQLWHEHANAKASIHVVRGLLAVLSPWIGVSCAATLFLHPLPFVLTYDLFRVEVASYSHPKLGMSSHQSWLTRVRSRSITSWRRQRKKNRGKTYWWLTLKLRVVGERLRHSANQVSAK